MSGVGWTKKGGWLTDPIDSVGFKDSDGFPPSSAAWDLPGPSGVSGLEALGLDSTLPKSSCFLGFIVCSFAAAKQQSFVFLIQQRVW
jgi:hypothetical protein